MKNYLFLNRTAKAQAVSCAKVWKYATTLLLLLTLGVGQMWAEPWLCRSTNGGNIATKTVGDKLNNGNEWNYTYTTNGGWSSESDIQVLVGISTSSYTSVNAGWVSDDGSNKNVAANIGNVTFDKSGKWYAVGKYKSGSTTAYTTTNNSWTNNTTLAFGSNSEPYWTVNPPAVSGFTVTPSGDGYVSGSGTEDDPYIMNCGGGNMTLTLSGSKAKTDDNSRLEYKSGTNSWNTTTTRTVNSASATTTAASLTLKMRCYNTSASLSGTESSITIWYKKESSSSVSVSVTPSAGGSASRTPTTMGYYSGGTITATPNTGYNFTRWDVTTGSGTIGSATTASTTFKPSTSSATVRATFTAKTINVTLNGNGGTGGSATVKYDANSLTSISHASWAGHSLTGYWTADSGGDKVLDADGTLNNVASWVSGGYWKKATDGTLYAQWTVDVTYYDVTYAVHESGHGSLSAANTSTSAAISSGASLVSGTGITFSASPNTGYEVDGWFSNSACTTPILGAGTGNTYATTLSSDLEVYVKFKEKTWSVAFAAGTGGSVTTPNSTPQTVGQVTGISIAATPSSGYSFSSWSSSSGGSFTSGTSTNSNTFKPTANTTVTASFSEIMRTITISGGTDYTSGETSTTAGVATSAKVTANAPTEGKKFTGWTLGSGVSLKGGYSLTDRTIEIYSTANATVTANYADRSSVKMYFAKPPVWGASTLYAYAWKSSDASVKNADYPGVELSTTETINCVTYYIYQYYTEGDGIGGVATGNSAWNRVIFGCGSDDKKTGDLTPSNGHYYYWDSSTTGATSAVTDVWYIKGTMNDWGTTHPIVHDCANHKGTVNINLTSGTTYEFKVYDVVNTKMWSNSTDCGTSSGDHTIKATMVSAATLYNDDENVMKITANVTGSYTFEVGSTNASNPTVKVTFPTSYTLTYSIGSVPGTDGSISCATASGSKVLSGSSVTLTGPAAKTGYSWKGWYTNAAGTTGKIDDVSRAITVTMNADKTLYACYTENDYTVTVAAGAGGSVANTSVTGHKDTKVTLPTATPNVGYVFTGWTVTTGTATLTSASSATAAQVNGMTAAVTVTANFAAATAFIEGRFHVTNSSRDGSWTNTFGDGDWDESSTAIKFTWDGTNSRYYLHTYATPNELTTQISSQNPVFYIKESSSSSSLANVTSYWSATSQTLSAAGTGNKRALAHTGDLVNYNLKFNSSDNSGYTIIYFDEAGIWYELEQTLKYDGNGSDGGSAPAGTVYYNKGTNATAASNTYTKTGYSFAGWNTQADGNGTSYAAAASVTMNSNITLYAQWTPNTYTVSFDKNGGSGATPGNITVTYDSPYGTLPAGPTPPGADQFAGWFTTASEEGTHVTASTIVTTASNHTLYARFEHTFTVNVQYKCGSDVLRPQTTVHASETSVAAEIEAPEILGYEFNNWTGDNATFADASSASTTVNVTAATTITANYRAVPMVYFKNNLDWDDVYVTFDAYFNSGSYDDAPGNNTKPYYKMEQLGSSDIFYCVIPETYVNSNYASWANGIAFNNVDFNSKATTTHVGDMQAFNGGEFTGRMDFDPKATMFIPYNGETETRNGGTYYKRGCWIQYNSNYSGYEVRVNTNVQGGGGTSTNVRLTSSVAGSTEFTARVYLGTANYTYGVMLYKDYQKNSNDLWYTNVNDEENTITSATTSLPWSFQPCDDSWQRCRVKTEALGDYIFTVSFATGIPMVNIEYPVTVGDFRLVYKDRATWNKTHDAAWSQASPVFKKTANRIDTASFFISVGSTPTVELQKCTAIDAGTGAETWTKQGDYVSLSSITEKGVYNFKVTQNADATSATVEAVGAYEGSYYIRTDASDGGWSNFNSDANKLTYSEYSMDHGGSSGPYSYYFMRHVNQGQNIKFVIANDYNRCLTDTLIDDTYAHEWIEAEANVRFTWNHENNEIHRAYINGSSNAADRFLVLEGDEHLYDADGNPLTGGTQIYGLNEHEMRFTDDQNWIYETTVQADPNERIKLTANFNGKIQYFYGAEGERSEATTYKLVRGTGSTKYKMRVVYDFKTNRLVCAWLPNSTITTETPIDADVMIIRYHQQDAQQITFSGSGKLTDVKTVYGAMEFNKYRLNNQNETGGHGDLRLSNYERDLFFISFPFDVKLNDVFGFGTYGKHWIIEYYDGKTRAKNGYWKDSPSNWKFVTKAMRDTFVLKAYEGYVLALDLEELTMESPIWTYGVENVYLYFPSETTLANIQATSKVVQIDTVGYQCNINRNTPHGDRRVKDSHWHLIGTPSFANANHPTSSSWSTDTDLEQTIYYPNLDPADWTTKMPYVYQWDAHENKFGVIETSSATFKAMQAYLVQYARDTIEWNQVNINVPASVAARRAEVKEAYEFRFELQQDGKELDHAFVSLRDDDEVTKGFDFNFDLCKELYGAFTPSSQLYTIIGDDVAAAGNCLPFSEQTTVVPVGINASADGEYTFAIPDGTEGVGITLVDNETGIRTELGLLDYTVHLTAGTYDQRFTLEISPVHKTPTGLETVTDDGLDDTGARKVMVDGLLYIVKDGKVFDARGARIQ